MGNREAPDITSRKELLNKHRSKQQYEASTLYTGRSIAQ
jgi:hypothetical protein